MAIDRKKTRDRAQKQLRKGNWERALQHYEDLVDDDPSDVRSRLKIADLYSRLDQTEKAVAAYEAAGDAERAVAFLIDAARDAARGGAAAEGLSVTATLLSQDVDVPVVGVAVHRESWPSFAMGLACSKVTDQPRMGSSPVLVSVWSESTAPSRR